MRGVHNQSSNLYLDIFAYFAKLQKFLPFYMSNENDSVFGAYESTLGLLREDLPVHEPGQGSEPNVVAVEVHDERGQGKPIQLLDQVWPDSEREGTNNLLSDSSKDNIYIQRYNSSLMMTKLDGCRTLCRRGRSKRQVKQWTRSLWRTMSSVVSSYRICPPSPPPRRWILPEDRDFGNVLVRT